MKWVQHPTRAIWLLYDEEGSSPACTVRHSAEGFTASHWTELPAPATLPTLQLAQGWCETVHGMVEESVRSFCFDNLVRLLIGDFPGVYTPPAGAHKFDPARRIEGGP